MKIKFALVLLALFLSSPLFAKDGEVGIDDFKDEEYETIHYSIYIPDTYDGSTPYSLFITLPGYEGLYFQGLKENLKNEHFAFEAVKYNDKMIVVSPQLMDWSARSAIETIELTEHILSSYNIDRDKVYLEGFSGGGETGSLVMGMRPDLYAAFLAISTRLDGDLNVLAASRTTIYLAIAENDTYYGSAPLKRAYEELCEIYRGDGVSDEENR